MILPDQVISILKNKSKSYKIKNFFYREAPKMFKKINFYFNKL